MLQKTFSRLPGGPVINLVEGFPDGASDKKNLPANAGDIRDTSSIPELERSPGVGMANHSSILVWRIPRMQEPGGLQSMGSQSGTQLKQLSTQAPVVETLNFQCRGHKFHPWLGN